MERPDLVSEFIGDIDHLRHFVGAIAMVVDEDVSAEHFSERLVRQVAGWRISLVIGVPLVGLAPIILRPDPRRTIAGAVAHARRGPAASSIYTLRVFTTRHLEAVFGTREFHRLNRASRDDLEHHAPAPDEIRGAR